MRRSIAVLALTMGMIAGLFGPAQADSTTVQGTSVIDKMFVNNGTSAVVVKVFGPGGKANVRWVNIRLRGYDGVTYVAQGAWYGETWAKSISRGQSSVACGGFTLTYNSTYHFWRFYIPRTCLGRLTNRIKVRAELITPASAIPGAAGPTIWLSRG
jgi:hypothetical protein